jgi:hypothetical protein
LEKMPFLFLDFGWNKKRTDITFPTAVTRSRRTMAFRHMSYSV